MLEKYLNAKKEQFVAFLNLPVDTPLQMLNLLKFKEVVEENGLTGEAQYNAYMKAAMPFIKNSNAKVLFYGEAKYSIIGPDKLEWDKVIIIEYAKKSDFVKMVTDKAYPSHLRTASLDDSRLIFCTPISK